MNKLQNSQKLLLLFAIGLSILHIVTFFRYKSFGNPNYPPSQLLANILVACVFGLSAFYQDYPKLKIVALLAGIIALVIYTCLWFAPYQNI